MVHYYHNMLQKCTEVLVQLTEYTSAKNKTNPSTQLKQLSAGKRFSRAQTSCAHSKYPQTQATIAP